MADRPRRTWQSLAVFVALVAVLLFPGIVFPHPGTNDAIWLADSEWLLILLEVVGAVAVYVIFPGARGVLIRSGVGVFLFGAGVSLVVALLVFGNMSNDRFAPLLFFPPVFGLLGLVGIVVAVATGVHFRAELLRGAGYGVAFAIVFGAFTLRRGAGDWLLAPYGFDLILLIAVLAIGIVVFGMSSNLTRRG